MPINQTELDVRLSSLSESVGDVELAVLREWIGDASDTDLFRANPLTFAQQHDIDEDAALDLFLYATECGLFRMEWNITCVSCGNVFKSFRHLDKVESSFHCTLCDMENTSRLDDVVHVSFTVEPLVRSIVFHDPDGLTLEQLLFDFHYSRSGRTKVGNTESADFLRDSTLFLQYLAPGESCSVESSLDDGSILVRDWTTSFALFVAMDAPKEELTFELAIKEDGLSHNGIGTARVPLETPVGTIDLPAVHGMGPADVTIVVRNESNERRPLWMVGYPPTFVPNVVSRLEWSGPLTARRVLNSQTFRKLFRHEAPGEGERLSVTDLTYLFTDIKDSTQMYDEIGDLTAYNVVRSHFDVLARCIAEHKGVIVKTVGDAVMATFLEPAHAVSAALEMVDAVRELAPELEIKVGVHRGHSIAVTLNERRLFRAKRQHRRSNSASCRSQRGPDNRGRHGIGRGRLSPRRCGRRSDRSRDERDC